MESEPVEKMDASPAMADNSIDITVSKEQLIDFKTTWIKKYDPQYGPNTVQGKKTIPEELKKPKKEEEHPYLDWLGVPKENQEQITTLAKYIPPFLLPMIANDLGSMISPKAGSFASQIAAILQGIAKGTPSNITTARLARLIANFRSSRGSPVPAGLSNLIQNNNVASLIPNGVSPERWSKFTNMAGALTGLGAAGLIGFLANHWNKIQDILAGDSSRWDPDLGKLWNSITLSEKKDLKGEEVTNTNTGSDGDDDPEGAKNKVQNEYEATKTEVYDILQRDNIRGTQDLAQTGRLINFLANQIMTAKNIKSEEELLTYLKDKRTAPEEPASLLIPLLKKVQEEFPDWQKKFLNSVPKDPNEGFIGPMPKVAATTPPTDLPTAPTPVDLTFSNLVKRKDELVHRIKINPNEPDLMNAAQNLFDDFDSYSRTRTSTTPTKGLGEEILNIMETIRNVKTEMGTQDFVNRVKEIEMLIKMKPNDPALDGMIENLYNDFERRPNRGTPSGLDERILNLFGSLRRARSDDGVAIEDEEDDGTTTTSTKKTSNQATPSYTPVPTTTPPPPPPPQKPNTPPPSGPLPPPPEKSAPTDFNPYWKIIFPRWKSTSLAQPKIRPPLAGDYETLSNWNGFANALSGVGNFFNRSIEGKVINNLVLKPINAMAVKPTTDLIKAVGTNAMEVGADLKQGTERIGKATYDLASTLGSAATSAASTVGNVAYNAASLIPKAIFVDKALDAGEEAIRNQLLKVHPLAGQNVTVGSAATSLWGMSAQLLETLYGKTSELLSHPFNKTETQTLTTTVPNATPAPAPAPTTTSETTPTTTPETTPDQPEQPTDPEAPAQGEKPPTPPNTAFQDWIMKYLFGGQTYRNDVNTVRPGRNATAGSENIEVPGPDNNTVVAQPGTMPYLVAGTPKWGLYNNGTVIKNGEIWGTCAAGIPGIPYVSTPQLIDTAVQELNPTQTDVQAFVDELGVNLNCVEAMKSDDFQTNIDGAKVIQNTSAPPEIDIIKEWQKYTPYKSAFAAFVDFNRQRGGIAPLKEDQLTFVLEQTKERIKDIESEIMQSFVSDPRVFVVDFLRGLSTITSAAPIVVKNPVVGTAAPAATYLINLLGQSIGQGAKPMYEEAEIFNKLLPILQDIANGKMEGPNNQLTQLLDNWPDVESKTPAMRQLFFVAREMEKLTMIQPDNPMIGKVTFQEDRPEPGGEPIDDNYEYRVDIYAKPLLDNVYREMIDNTARRFGKYIAENNLVGVSLNDMGVYKRQDYYDFIGAKIMSRWHFDKAWNIFKNVYNREMEPADFLELIKTSKSRLDYHIDQAGIQAQYSLSEMSATKKEPLPTFINLKQRLAEIMDKDVMRAVKRAELVEKYDIQEQTTSVENIQDLLLRSFADRYTQNFWSEKNRKFYIDSFARYSKHEKPGLEKNLGKGLDHAIEHMNNQKTDNTEHEKVIGSGICSVCKNKDLNIPYYGNNKNSEVFCKHCHDGNKKTGSGISRRTPGIKWENIVNTPEKHSHITSAIAGARRKLISQDNIGQWEKFKNSAKPHFQNFDFENNYAQDFKIHNTKNTPEQNKHLTYMLGKHELDHKQSLNKHQKNNLNMLSINHMLDNKHTQKGGYLGMHDFDSFDTLHNKLSKHPHCLQKYLIT